MVLPVVTRQPRDAQKLPFHRHDHRVSGDSFENGPIGEDSLMVVVFGEISRQMTKTRRVRAVRLFFLRTHLI